MLCQIININPTGKKQVRMATLCHSEYYREPSSWKSFLLYQLETQSKLGYTVNNAIKTKRFAVTTASSVELMLSISSTDEAVVTAKRLVFIALFTV